MGNFSVGFNLRDTVQVLSLKGELDAHTASELEAAIQKCKDDGRYRIIAVSYTHLTLPTILLV